MHGVSSRFVVKLLGEIVLWYYCIWSIAVWENISWYYCVCGVCGAGSDAKTPPPLPTQLLSSG